MKRCRFPLFLIGEIHNCRKESGLSKRGVNVAAKKAEKNSAIQKKFYISQIETTKRIIKTFSETTEFSPAMLINSLLSLVILPYERAKESGGGRIFPGKYPDLIRKIGISPQIFTPIQSCSNGDVVYNRKTIYTLVPHKRRIRGAKGTAARQPDGRYHQAFCLLFGADLRRQGIP